MKEKIEKYAELILKKGVNIQEGQPIVLSCNLEQYEFIRIFTSVAHKLGVKDIYYSFTDEVIKHDQLLNLSEEEILNNNIWDKTMYNDYARKDCAFVFVTSGDPDIMSDINVEKYSNVSRKVMLMQNEARLRRFANINTWCIALVPTLGLAKKIFPNESEPINKLWNVIFECCLVNENPINSWNEKLEKVQEKVDKLNDFKIKQLHYTNSLGTDLYLELPKEIKWCYVSTRKKNTDIEFVPNIPSEEIFTSPLKDKTNGIVYASKVLVYQGKTIKDFYIKFRDGKVVEVSAKENEETLRNMLKEYEGMNMLGEVALVEYNSPISNSNILFYDTLYDENAACHLALGDAFEECLEVENDDKEKYGLNKCDNHIDFMIGTSDLKISALTYDGKEIEIFNNGNFCI